MRSAATAAPTTNARGTHEATLDINDGFEPSCAAPAGGSAMAPVAVSSWPASTPTSKAAAIFFADCVCPMESKPTDASPPEPSANSQRTNLRCGGEASPANVMSPIFSLDSIKSQRVNSRQSKKGWCTPACPLNARQISAIRFGSNCSLKLNFAPPVSNGVAPAVKTSDRRLEEAWPGG
eukprot:GHVT01095748.1.p2 GENE.GHVT01095748.1~~GHVT01095748.1.p2  ORF type:complete len:179 (-),score=30.94 GHVT01095748.1:1014-1550(-)